jgi:hypothetical protein
LSVLGSLGEDGSLALVESIELRMGCCAPWIGEKYQQQRAILMPRRALREGRLFSPASQQKLQNGAALSLAHRNRLYCVLPSGLAARASVSEPLPSSG